MKTAQPFLLHSLRRPFAGAVLASLLAGSAFAQAPAAGAAAPAPRTDAMAARPAPMAGLLTVAQQAAVDGPANLVTAVTTARSALAAASLTLPANPADIATKANALAAAEQALALARADGFATIPAEFTAAAKTRATGGAGRGGLMTPRVADDLTGFAPIFDGKTLTGWDGDPKFWRAEAGTIVGESTPENPVSQNTFLIWRGAVVKDFELKAEVRMNGTNSGIQYRSRNMTEVNPWVVGGYQADIDFANQYTGGLGEERGRSNVMVTRGQMIRLTANGEYKFLGTMGDPAEIQASIIQNGWNSLHIIAKGNMVVHILNGRVSAIMIDEDEVRRMKEGIIALQMHTGQPFKVEYRNLMYKGL